MPSGAAPLVSVIVPAYNGAQFIAQTLRSALAQTHRNIEVIVVDDGSTDETPAIVEAFAARDPRVRLVRQANQGVAGARDRGFALSTGAFIAPLDQDDLWQPTMLTKALAVFASGSPRLGLVYVWTQRIDEHGRELPGEHITHTIEGECFHQCVTINPVGHSSGMLLRRDVIEALGGLGGQLKANGAAGCEDAKLCIDVAARYELAYVPEILVGYRKHADSMSRNARRMIPAFEAMIRLVRASYPQASEADLRRSLSSATFWLITDPGRVSLFVRYLPLLLRRIAADPGFLLNRWMLVTMLRLPLRATRRPFRLLAQRLGLRRQARPPYDFLRSASPETGAAPLANKNAL